MDFERYNCLLDDEDQATTKEHHLNKLAQLFVDYNAQKIFGLHLIHGHFRIPPNTVMLGTIFEGRLSCCWTKPSPFEAILSKPVHGHIYTFSPDHHLLPYEYRDGDVPKGVTDIDQAFFWELSEYLSSNKLAELLGLEVFDDTWSPQPQMSEIVLAGQGTVMVKGEDVENAEPYKVTGWCFAQDENGIVSVKGQETHAAVNGEHKIFRDTKPLSNIDAVLDLLLQERIIKDSC